VSAVTQAERILAALREGPGTSGEIAAETGLPLKHCCAYLRSLWQAGRLRRELHRRSGLRSAFVYHLICLLLLASPALAADPPESAGAALWATQRGQVDRGVAYPLARWRSLVQEDRLLALEALVGVDGAGLGISREFYAETGEQGRRRSLALGLGAVAGYAASEGDALKVVLYGVMRLGRKGKQ
jgi:hypothetical protein